MFPRAGVAGTLSRGLAARRAVGCDLPRWTDGRAMEPAATATRQSRDHHTRTLGKGTIFPIIHFPVSDATHDSRRVQGHADSRFSGCAVASTHPVGATLTIARRSGDGPGEHLPGGEGDHFGTPQTRIRSRSSGSFRRMQGWFTTTIWPVQYRVIGTIYGAMVVVGATGRRQGQRACRGSVVIRRCACWAHG